MITTQSVFKLKSNIALKQENTKYAAIDAITGARFELSVTAYEFLSYLDGKRSFDEIIEMAYAAYEVDRQVLKEDLIELFEVAMKKNIIAQVK